MDMFGTSHFVLVVLSSEVKIHQYNREGTSNCVFYKERFFPMCPLFRVSVIGGSTVYIYRLMGYIHIIQGMYIQWNPPIKDTLNKEHLSIKDKSTFPNSYYTSTF